MDRKVLKKNSECVILRDYDKCYDTFNYYLFSTEGEIVLSVTNCNCKEIPSVIEEKFEKFSLEERHKKEKEEFKAWLKSLGLGSKMRGMKNEVENGEKGEEVEEETCSRCR